jgi:hypothetical protein
MKRETFATANVYVPVKRRATLELAPPKRAKGITAGVNQYRDYGHDPQKAVS